MVLEHMIVVSNGVEAVIRNRCAILLTVAALAFGASPRRIVSVSPAVTEILYGIGAFDRVVAVTDYCLYPPQAKSLPKVGGWATPSMERIAGFHPDLVAFSDAQAPFLEMPLAQLGIHTAVARSQTIQDAYDAIATLGRATGNEIQAARLTAEIKGSLESVRRRAASLPHPSVITIIDRTPGTLRDLYAVTQGSYLAELISTAGGTPAGGSSRLGYGKISKEASVTINPEVILDIEPGSQTTAGAHPEAAWQELPEIRAVRYGRVYIVRDEFVPHDSQMIAKTAVLFARLLHPDVPPREWERH
jgi:iron complex transport system substrate-binding protein